MVRFVATSSTAWEMVNPPFRLKFARAAALSASGLLNLTVMCCKSTGGSVRTIAGGFAVPNGVITLVILGSHASAILS